MSSKNSKNATAVADRKSINLLHILAVAPLLFYVGYNGRDTPEPVFNILTILAVLVLLYHGYRYSQ